MMADMERDSADGMPMPRDGEPWRGAVDDSAAGAAGGTRDADEKTSSPPSRLKTGERVQQIDPATGKVLRVFAGVSAAARALGGKSASNVRNAILRGGTAYGYRWRYVNGHERMPASTPARHVEMIRPESGQLVRVFPSVNHAARYFGLRSTDELYSAIRDGEPRCGFMWRYSDSCGYPIEQLDPDTNERIVLFPGINEAARTVNGGDAGPICRALIEGGIAHDSRWRLVDLPGLGVPADEGRAPDAGTGIVFKAHDRRNIVYGVRDVVAPGRSYVSASGNDAELSFKLADALTLWVETGVDTLLLPFME